MGLAAGAVLEDGIRLLLESVSCLLAGVVLAVPVVIGNRDALDGRHSGGRVGRQSGVELQLDPADLLGLGGGGCGLGVCDNLGGLPGFRVQGGLLGHGGCRVLALVQFLRGRAAGQQ